MSTSAEQIKDKLNIVDVVSAYLRLDKAGVNMKGCCPFHNEKTASFFVSPSRQSFHCFGCNKGGDVITFVQEIEGLDFIEALKMLAERAGIELDLKSGPQKSDNKEKEIVLRVLEEATRFYEKKIKEFPEVIKYLEGRGVTLESMEKFRLGYVPEGWRYLADYLEGEGHHLLTLEKAGLVAKKEGSGETRYYDRFRGRIMFPLINSGGSVVGFSGRIYDPNNSREEEAKYLNSPQTIVYDKSKLLYGLDKAKMAIRKLNKAILVEGQMDLVMSNQSGLENAVAVSGTALTDKHLLSLKRLSNNLIMAFDADEAGISASRRAVELAVSLGLELKMAAFPEGLDPADVAKDDPKKLNTIINQALHVVDFYLAILIKKHDDRRERAHAIKSELYSLIKRLPEKIDQAHFISKIADVTSLPEDIIWQDIRETAVSTGPKFFRVERKASEQTTAPPNSPQTRIGRIFRQIVGIWWWLGEETGEKFESSKLYRELEEVVGTVYIQAGVERLLASKGEILLEIEINYGSERISLEKVLAELGRSFKEEYLKLELGNARTKLKEAEVVGDTSLIDKYLKKCQDISNLINKKA
ncbi:MAG: DNA primase [Patescibacteria group bacterium]